MLNRPDVQRVGAEFKKGTAPEQALEVALHFEETAAVTTDDLVNAIAELQTAVLERNGCVGGVDEPSVEVNLLRVLAHFYALRVWLVSFSATRPADCNTFRRPATSAGSSTGKSGSRGKPPGCPRMFMAAFNWA